MVSLTYLLASRLFERSFGYSEYKGLKVFKIIIVKW
jgi:hypothetical protein